MGYIVDSIQLLSLVIVAPLMWILYTILFLVQTLKGSRKLKEPKNIIITGASSGLGLDIAKSYAAPGVTLALTGRNKERLEKASKECQAKGAKVVLGIMDVIDRSAIQDFVVKFDEENPVDLVIANAGVTEATSGTSRDLVAATRTLFATNVDGMANTVLPLINRMKERKSGQIALMSSLSGLGGAPAMTSYAATKCAVKAYGEGLRGLIARDGVAVNVICPGYVATPMTDIEKKDGRPMPFMVSAEYAVRRIRSGLRNNEGTIVFPNTMYYLGWVLACICPPHVRDVIAKSRLIAHTAYFGKRREKKGDEEKKQKKGE